MPDPGTPTSPPGDGRRRDDAVDPARPPAGSTLAQLDRWMHRHPWHPRILPFVLYVALLAAVYTGMDHLPASYPVIYGLQCGLVAWLMWRYRALTPELTVTFHWSAIPVGVVVFVAWMGLGFATIELFPRAFGDPVDTPIDTSHSPLLAWLAAVFPVAFSQRLDEGSFFVEMGVTVGWLALALRLLGMSILVPLFEELFVRSLLLRGLSRARETGMGVVQVLHDMPVIGEWVMHTKLGERADRHPPVFGRQFERTPLGSLTVFGVAASTAIFAVHHLPRDYAGAVFCGVAYCLHLRYTRDKGLGPVIWAHGITNALIWAYTLHTGDWRFL